MDPTTNGGAMTEPETRSLLRWEHENPDVYNQEAIPWCTTHNVQRSGDQPYCKDARAPDIDAEIHECEISSGGPDHKWWKDT